VRRGDIDDPAPRGTSTTCSPSGHCFVMHPARRGSFEQSTAAGSVAESVVAVVPAASFPPSEAVGTHPLADLRQHPPVVRFTRRGAGPRPPETGVTEPLWVSTRNLPGL
jgi:hypothetical protein